MDGELSGEGFVTEGGSMQKWTAPNAVRRPQNLNWIQAKNGSGHSFSIPSPKKVS